VCGITRAPLLRCQPKHARAALSGAAIALLAPSAVASERIGIPAGEMVLHAVLFRPSGTGPFPAVIGLHGCGGLDGGAGTLSRHYEDWAEHLVADGIVVLLPDSYVSRGLGGQCNNRNLLVRNAIERVADAKAARVWLQSQPWVAAHRISLMGWTNGAIAALWRFAPSRFPRMADQTFALPLPSIPDVVGLPRRPGVPASRRCSSWDPPTIGRRWLRASRWLLARAAVAPG